MLERYYNSRDIAVLKGKTITDVEGLDGNKDILVFRCDDGTAYKMYHQRDGQEIVFISKMERIESFEVPAAILKTPAEPDEPSLRHIRNIRKAMCGSPVRLAERIVFDRELIIREGDEARAYIPSGRQKTLFLLATGHGVVSITWVGYSEDETESTEIDFVQVEGDGVWKEQDA